MASQEEKWSTDRLTSLGLDLGSDEEASASAHTHHPMQRTPTKKHVPSEETAQYEDEKQRRYRLNMEREMREQASIDHEQEQRERAQHQALKELEELERQTKLEDEQRRLKKIANPEGQERLGESAEQMMMILKQIEASSRLSRLDDLETARAERAQQRREHAYDMQQLSRMNHSSLDESLSALKLKMTTQWPVSTKLKRVQPATFHGTAPENAEMWLKRFDLWSNMSGESSKDAKLLNFLILMKGTTDAWLSRLPDYIQENYDQLIARFLSFFDNL